MIGWEWTRKQIPPDDALDAARSIPVTRNWVAFDLVEDWGWQPPELYLGWAKDALARNDACGWDSAAGWAKRAVCRRMDGILAHNHLVCFLGKNYKVKTDLLAELRVPGLRVLRDTVIDPRNGIEHEYETATEHQASRACEVAELFMMATEKEADQPAIISLCWNADYLGEMSTALNRTFEKHIFGLTPDRAPMLLVDHFAAEPVVLVLHPKDSLLNCCPLRDFKSEQVIRLNARLRECLKPDKTGAYCFSSKGYNREMWKRAQAQLKL